MAGPMTGQADSGIWDKRFNNPNVFVYGTEPNAGIKEAALKYLPAGQPRTAAELGSGEGRNVVFLAQLGHHISAVDFSTSGLEKTRLLAEQQGVDPSLISYQLADVLTWQPPNGAGLDAVVISFCHVFQDQKEQFYNNIKAMLKPGGLLIMEMFHPDQIIKGYRARSGGPPDPAMLHTIPELQGLLTGGQELEAAQLEYELREGALHDGMGAVVRYVWRKAE